MSSGYISDDRKTVSFEVSVPQTSGVVSIHLLEQEEHSDRIMIKMATRSYAGSANYTEGTNQIIVSKAYAKVLSHAFRRFSEVMDEWFDEETPK